MNAYLARGLTIHTIDVRSRLCVSTYFHSMWGNPSCRKHTAGATSNLNGRAANITMRSAAGTAGFW